MTGNNYSLFVTNGCKLFVNGRQIRSTKKYDRVFEEDPNAIITVLHVTTKNTKKKSKNKRSKA